MDSAVDQAEGYLPSFAQTLSEMSADEAHYLDRLWTFFLQRLDINTSLPFAMWPVERWKLMEVYDPNFRVDFGHAEYWLHKDKMGDADKATYAKLNHIELVIGDLIRLGIISPAEPTMGSKTASNAEYALTHYGVSFIAQSQETQAQRVRAALMRPPPRVIHTTKMDETVRRAKNEVLISATRRSRWPI